MPVIRRADDDRVDVTARDQFAIVAVHGDLRRLDAAFDVGLLDDGHAIGGARRVELADRDEIRQAGLDDAGHVVAQGDTAAADLTHTNAAVCAPDARWNEERSGGCPYCSRAYQVSSGKRLESWQQCPRNEGRTSEYMPRGIRWQGRLNAGRPLSRRYRNAARRSDRVAKPCVAGYRPKTMPTPALTRQRDEHDLRTWSP